jgi:serine phosphatase RsbU (regulator of sigma subunit)
MPEARGNVVNLQQGDDPLSVKLAGEVQKLLMPKSSPSCSWCCMAARSRMANVLGGDFYDFIELDNGCQVLFVGDVTGHGLHASVVMSLVYGFIHRALQQRCSQQSVVADLNTFLRKFAQRSALLDHFFSTTLFFGVIDPKTMTMHYINAGHPAGLVRRKGGLLRLPATSHPVGYFEQTEFQEETFQLADNDRLLLYTDGLVDSSNPHGEMFGVERLDEAFGRLDGDSMVFLQLLFDEIGDYLAGQPAFDDCTAIVIDFPHTMLTGGK